MQKKIWRKILPLLLAVVMMFTTGGSIAFASEDITYDDYNHGTIAISAEDGNTQVDLAVGDTFAITVSPYMHVQYLGCDMDYCPHGCGDGCFIVGLGCGCFTEPTLRTAAVTVSADQDDIVMIGDVAAGDDSISTLGAMTDGTITVRGVSEGTVNITVSAALRDWVSTTETFTVTVTDGSTTDDREKTGVSVVDVEGWTTHGDPVIDESTGTDTQVLHIELTFSEAVSIVDKDALIAEMNLTLGAASLPTPSDVSLSADGLTLSITVEGWYAAYSGLFETTDVWENLVAADGTCADSSVSFFVPDGVTTEIVEQVIADGDQNASVTTRFVTDENCTRSMVHLLLLKNGDPIQLTSYGATATGHFHDYLTLTAAEFTDLAKDYLNARIGGDDGEYIIDYEDGSDEITITAVSSQEGDILELHVMSYLNNGTKSIDASALGDEIENSEAVSGYSYTAVSRAAFEDALAKAQTVYTDTTWYSQTDVDTVTENLAKAREALIIQTDTLAVRQGNVFYFQNMLDDETYTNRVAYGRFTDEVLVGDWDGDGVDTLVVRRGNKYYFSNDTTFQSSNADYVLTYGRSTDEVLVGDWDGDGVDTLAVRRGNTYYFTNDAAFESEVADVVLQYGKPSDEVLVGDWDGDGADTPAVRRGAMTYISNDLTSSVAVTEFEYGRASDTVLAGDWNGDGSDTLAVRRGNVYLFRYELTSGTEDLRVTYGEAADEVLVGKWQ